VRAPGIPTPIITASTVVVSASPATLHQVIVGTELGSGTLKLYNTAEAGGVGAGTLISSIKLDTRGVFEFEAYFSVGIVAVLSGTADVTIVAG
jgi:hypothetical protein